MSVASKMDSTAPAVRKADQQEDISHKVRCLCGKWWSYKHGDTLVLRCKLCRRDIVITGENLKITYR